MYPLAHMTFACGAVWAGAGLLDRTRVLRAWKTSQRVDYRLVALGALLPDLIDKPIGWVLFRDTFDGSDHLFAHTLLFPLTLLVPGFYLWVRLGDPRLVGVGMGVLSHLASDPVTHAPQILFWPLLGLDFPDVSLLNRPATIATETAAALILLLAARSLRRQNRLGVALHEGRL